MQPGSSAREGVRLVMVMGLSQAEAARRAGTTRSSIHNAMQRTIQRAKRRVELSPIVAEALAESG